MTGDNEKTQPQELLEEVIGITHGDRNEDEKFPTLAEQQEYWRRKEAQESDQTPFTCTQKNPDGKVCDRTFKSPKAVAMHVARVHTKTILAPREGKPKDNRTVGDIQAEGRPVETLDTHRKKWSLARRRRYNAKKKAQQIGLPIGGEPIKWSPLPLPPQEEPVAMIRFCPCCGKNIERWLA